MLYPLFTDYRASSNNCDSVTLIKHRNKQKWLPTLPQHAYAVTHTHTHVRTRTHARARAHARTHTYTHARAHTHARTHTHAHTHMNAHTHARTHVRAHTHTRACTVTYIHTHTHTHTHTHSNRNKSKTKTNPTPHHHTPPPPKKKKQGGQQITAAAATRRQKQQQQQQTCALKPNDLRTRRDAISRILFGFWCTCYAVCGRLNNDFFRANKRKIQFVHTINAAKMVALWILWIYVWVNDSIIAFIYEWMTLSGPNVFLCCNITFFVLCLA